MNDQPQLLRGPVRGHEGSTEIFDEAGGIDCDLSDLTASTGSTTSALAMALASIAWTIAVVVALSAPAAVIAAWKVLL